MGGLSDSTRNRYARCRNTTEVDRKKGQITASKSPFYKWLLDHDRLSDLLNDGRSRTFTARSIVVYPEWYVERTGIRNKEDVWVLNPKALEKFLSCEPVILSSERIDSVANALTRHSRQLAA